MRPVSRLLGSVANHTRYATGKSSSQKSCLSSIRLSNRAVLFSVFLSVGTWDALKSPTPGPRSNHVSFRRNPLDAANVSGILQLNIKLTIKHAAFPLFTFT